jgi:hypothetical protein
MTCFLEELFKRMLTASERGLTRITDYEFHMIPQNWLVLRWLQESIDPLQRMFQSTTISKESSKVNKNNHIYRKSLIEAPDLLFFEIQKFKIFYLGPLLFSLRKEGLLLEVLRQNKLFLNIYIIYFQAMRFSLSSLFVHIIALRQWSGQNVFTIEKSLSTAQYFTKSARIYRAFNY